MRGLFLELALRSGFSTADVARIVATAPARYKSYEIPKRTGGTRTISQPSRELKALQRIVMDVVLSRFPVHDRATAYEAGRSILRNAAEHVGRPALMKLDFLSFFPSIKVKDFVAFLAKRNAAIDAADLDALCRILFWGKGSYEPICLSIGAPSSPRISNILLHDIDEAAAQVSAAMGLIYTRYADDVTVSGATIELLKCFEKEFRQIISSAPFPRLRFNSKKRGVYVRGQKQMVTGLILTPVGTVSIGRERKRLISAMVHRATRGELTVADLDELRGLLAFARGCEPEFLNRLSAKYGANALQAIAQRG